MMPRRHRLASDVPQRKSHPRMFQSLKGRSSWLSLNASHALSTLAAYGNIESWFMEARHSASGGLVTEAGRDHSVEVKKILQEVVASPTVTLRLPSIYVSLGK